MQRGDAWEPVAQRLSERYPSVVLDHAAELPDPGTVPVGYSMGGRLLLHQALDVTQGTVPLVTRWPALVLVGVSAGVDDPQARRAADEELAAWMEGHTIEEVVERWEASPVFATQSEELRAAQRPGRLSHDPPALAADLRRFGQGAMPPVWDRLSELELPVLCLAGALDETYVAAGRRMATLLPRGTFRTIPRGGHAPQLEAPDAVATELAAFLDECG
jgi:pimeloyl-ACP methyl ester carboxylesterase